MCHPMFYMIILKPIGFLLFFHIFLVIFPWSIEALPSSAAKALPLPARNLRAACCKGDLEVVPFGGNFMKFGVVSCHSSETTKSQQGIPSCPCISRSSTPKKTCTQSSQGHHVDREESQQVLDGWHLQIDRSVIYLLQSKSG